MNLFDWQAGGPVGETNRAVFKGVGAFLRTLSQTENNSNCAIRTLKSLQNLTSDVKIFFKVTHLWL